MLLTESEQFATPKVEEPISESDRPDSDRTARSRTTLQDAGTDAAAHQPSDAFASLIAPLRIPEFFLRFWSKEYLISDGAADRFSNLFSWNALSTILSTQRFEFPRLRLLSGGRVAPPAQYIVRKVDRRGAPYATHDPVAVARMLREGAMLHITSIGETWEPLARFASELEPVLGGRVQVNLHAGYSRSRGFHTHWDGHDVYAVQIDGCKKWRLFGITEDHPLAVPPEEKTGAPIDHVWEGILGTGQVLYLPRGYWHATQFTDSPSLHLTFAVQHPTVLDFGHWVVSRLATSGFGRSDVPLPIFDLPDIGEHSRTRFLERVRELLQREISIESFVRYTNDYKQTLGIDRQVHLNPSERNGI